jgi:hypothetical protein
MARRGPRLLPVASHEGILLGPQIASWIGRARPAAGRLRCATESGQGRAGRETVLATCRAWPFSRGTGLGGGAAGLLVIVRTVNSAPRFASANDATLWTMGAAARKIRRSPDSRLARRPAPQAERFPAARTRWR